MNLNIRIVIISVVFFLGQVIFAQDKKQIALDKGLAAIKLMDEGKLDESIKLLEEAEKLDPDRFDFPYEMAYAYYMKTDYKEAAKILEKNMNHKNVTDRLFQLLGNSYDNIGKSEKAIEIYETGLKKFPESGNIYLELGVIQMGKKDYNSAINYFEKGIEVDPKFSSNYYWATKIYCSSTEEVWGMIYGEIFMNIERNTKRTAEISKLLFDTYKSEIKFTSDSSFSVSFSKNATMNADDLKDPSKIKLPFGIGLYEPILMLSMLSVKSIDINSLDNIRSNFVENYFQKDHYKTYPNILFSYQNQIKKAGYMDAYNHWLLMKGDEDGFSKWQLSNKEKWSNFIKWFGDNKLIVDNTNRFFRGQY